MGTPSARLTDMTACPMVSPGPVPHVGGPIIGPCSPDVVICKMPAARITDKAQCVGPTDVIIRGSATVLINNLNAARIGDQTIHGGVIITGCPTVLIGDKGGGSPGAPGDLAFADANKQVKALQSAASDGKPFCEECYG